MRVILATIVLVSAMSWSDFADASSLDGYIDQALEKNLGLRQQQLDFESSRAAQKEAAGGFLPSVDLNGRYTRAGGGRAFEFPVGDLMNPVYGALNELLGEQRFESIANIQADFLREEEYETKLSLTQPLFQPAVYYNYRAQSNQRRAAEAARDTKARELVAEVKSAYYTYLKADQLVRLLAETEKLLQENLRVSQSLFDNDQATRDVVYRAQAELSSLMQQQAEADKSSELARSQFNLLLDRDLEAEIQVDSIDISGQLAQGDLKTARSQARANREEFRRLESGIAAAGNVVSINRTRFLPGVALAVDYGYEGEELEFGSDNDFWTASVVMKWNIFSGFRDSRKVQQAKLARKSLEARQREVERLIDLEVTNAHHSLKVSERSLAAAADRLQAAEASFRIVRRKFAEGLAPQIDFLDARNSLTQAEVNNLVVQYDFLIARAELERVTASYPLQLNSKDKS